VFFVTQTRASTQHWTPPAPTKFPEGLPPAPKACPAALDIFEAGCVRLLAVGILHHDLKMQNVLVDVDHTAANIWSS
jgi:hypothetical protein